MARMAQSNPLLAQDRARPVRTKLSPAFVAGLELFGIYAGVVHGAVDPYARHA